jgi:hypothetical protein
VDNFEWGFGYRMRFGMYKWEQDDEEQRREERGSAALLRHWFARLKANVPKFHRSLTPHNRVETQDGKEKQLMAA